MVKLREKDQCFLKTVRSLPPVAQACTCPLATGICNGYIGKGGTVKPTRLPFIMLKKVIVLSHLEIEHGLRFFWYLLDT